MLAKLHQRSSDFRPSGAIIHLQNQKGPGGIPVYSTVYRRVRPVYQAVYCGAAPK